MLAALRTLIYAGAIALVICGYTCALAQDAVTYSEEAEEAFDLALISFENGDFEKASRVFSRLAKATPMHQKTSASYIMGARSFLEDAYPKRAIDLLTPFFIKFPNSMYQIEATILYGDAQLQLEQYREALKSYAIGLSLTTNEKHRDAIRGRIRSLLFSGNLDTPTIEAALEDVPDDRTREEIEVMLSSLVKKNTRPKTKPAETPEPKKSQVVEDFTASSFKIAIVLPDFSGDAARQAIVDDVRLGMLTAFETYQGKNQCIAEPVVYTFETEDTLNALIEAIAGDDTFIAIAGGIFSNDSKQLVKAAQPYSIPVVLPTATGEELTVHDGVYQLNVPFRERGRVMAEYAFYEMGAQRAAVLAPLESFARLMAEEFKAHARKLGMSVEIVTWYTPGDDDLSRQFFSLRSGIYTDSIDVLFAPIASPADIAAIMDGIETVGLRCKILGAGDWNYPDSLRTHVHQQFDQFLRHPRTEAFWDFLVYLNAVLAIIVVALLQDLVGQFCQESPKRSDFHLDTPLLAQSRESERKDGGQALKPL